MAVSPTPGVGVAGVAVSALTSLVPDLDHPSSRAVRRLGPAGWVLCRIIRFVSHLAVGRRHRGLSHSVLFALLIGCLTGVVASRWLPVSHSVYLGSAGTAGMVSALAGDLVTLAGLDHLLWPSQRRVSVPRHLRIRTGGPTERWVVLPGLTLAAAVGLAVLTGIGPAVVEGWTARG